MYYLCNMEWLNSLFFEHTPLQAVVILSIIIAVGLGLGKIHLFGISLGVTFVFFAGILAGHLGFSIDPNMLNYAESFGLVLFASMVSRGQLMQDPAHTSWQVMPKRTSGDTV